MQLTYRDSGVDIDAGDELVDRIKPHALRTRIAEVVSSVGGFAGLCALPTGMSEPILVSGTDGVGTKLRCAFETGRHDSIGIDLVAMCVNDILTVGARPLFFLDYFATAKLDVGVAEAVIRGIADGCQESQMALLGGETAELPGMYHAGHYDLAGFAVGVVDKARMVDGSTVEEGDVVLALPSSGLHSNGYALARRALLDASGFSYDARPPELMGDTIAECMLRPTRIYARAVRAMLSEPKLSIRAMAHITGGGIAGNLPRVLPDGLGVRLTQGWKRPCVYDLLARVGVAEAELRRTFNIGIGYVFIVDKATHATALERLRSLDPEALSLGEVVRVDPATPFEDRVQFA